MYTKAAAASVTCISSKCYVPECRNQHLLIGVIVTCLLLIWLQAPRSTVSAATTPRTPRTNPPTATATPFSESPFADAQMRPAAQTPDRLQPQSVPATPEPTAEFGGNTVGLGANVQLGNSGTEHGIANRAAGVSPAAAHRQQMLLPEPLGRQVVPSGRSKLYGLPSAEDIDALCDMDNPSHQSQQMDPSTQTHPHAVFNPADMAPTTSLAPILTSSTADTYDESADRPSSSGTQNTYTNDVYTPQHSSTSQFKRGPVAQSRHFASPSRYEAPESSVPHPQSFRMQSECDSSAYDEGASSTLVHSISNEEQIMQDLLEEDNDDIFYNNNMDTQQHDREGERTGNRVEQLNTMELHGILGQHGYKLPELAPEQEEEEESDGDADGEDGDGDEDLDDNEEDEEDDIASDKSIYKVGFTAECRIVLSPMCEKSENLNLSISACLELDAALA